MSDVTEKKLNTGFLMRPYSFFQGTNTAHPTRAETMLRGWVYSMTRTEGQVCRFGYSNFVEKFGLSRATVARNMRKLCDEGVISARREGGQKSVYTYKAKAPKTSHVRTELWFYTTKFKVGDSERYLTNAEVDVLSLIYTHTRNDRTKSFKGSVRDIAAILNISEKTVMRAITALFAADLIFRPSIGLNRHKKSVFTANMKVLRKIDRETKKAEKAQAKEQAQLPAHVQAANAKAERDKFYAARQERSRKLVDYFTAKAEENPRFNELERALSRLELELAKADVAGSALLPELQEKKKMLLSERLYVLETQGVEPWQLDERAHAICKECFDTGHRSDGRACSCYRCQS